MKRVCVYCGSSPGSDPAYLAAARELGGSLARRGLGLVYGGASVGTMGAVADGALAAGGEVIGVLPDFLEKLELAHRGLTELHVVSSMHERKAKMAELADAFIALPGGYGTLEEISEALTWSQLGLHRKACALLDVAGFYGHFVAFLDHAVEAGMLRPGFRAMLLVEREPEALLERLAAFVPPEVPRILDASRT
jgi:uncharacterized protein (TIGR00730 family)